MSLPAAAADVYDEAERERVVIGAPLAFGAFVGWHATGDLDVVGERVEGNEPDAGVAFGLRLGWRTTQTFGFDLSAGAIPAGPSWLVPVLLEGRWRPLAGTLPDDAGWTPTLGVGGGMYAGLGRGGDVDALLSAGVGAEVMLGRAALLRIEAAVWLSDGIASAVAFSPVFTVGFDLLAFRERMKGVEAVSAKPLKPLPAPKGCPAGVAPERCGNADSDAFIDAFDRCPLVGGAIDGCPDDDGDGVTGLRDGCPNKRGAAVDWGCPR